MSGGKEYRKIGCWVTCPICGNKLMKAKVVDAEMPCKCGVLLKVYISDNLVITWSHGRDEDSSFWEEFEIWKQHFSARSAGTC